MISRARFTEPKSLCFRFCGLTTMMKLCVVVLLSGATLSPLPMDCVGQGIKADVGVFEETTQGYSVSLISLSV